MYWLFAPASIALVLILAITLQDINPWKGALTAKHIGVAVLLLFVILGCNYVAFAMFTLVGF